MKKFMPRLLCMWMLATALCFGACAKDKPSVLQSASDSAAADAPVKIENLSVRRPNLYSVELAWIAPGDVGDKGTAQRYDVRYNVQPIDESNWETSERADVTITPQKAGAPEVLQVNELDPGETYYFAIKTVGYNDALSHISNVVSATTGSPGVPDSVTVNNLADLQAAIDNAPESGRIITLAKGVYHQTERILIDHKDNITIQGETDNPEDTVLIGLGMDDESMYMNMKVTESSYCTVKNLTLRDSYYHAIQVVFSAHYFRAENLIALDNGESGFKINGLSDYGVIEDCYIGFTANGKRSVIEGIDGIAARGWLVKGNVIENIIQLEENIDLREMSWYDDWIGFGIFFKANSIDCVLEDNLLINCDVALSFGGSGSGGPIYRYNDESYETRGGVMRNNVVWGTVREAGIYVNSAKDFEIVNNTIYDDCETGSVSFYSMEKNPNLLPSEGGKIYNNILRYGVEDGNPAYVVMDTIDQQNNLVPEEDIFVDAANGDFRLKPGVAFDGEPVGAYQ